LTPWNWKPSRPHRSSQARSERRSLITLTVPLLETAKTLRTPTNQVCFLAVCGYFKAVKKFFEPEALHRRDLDYLSGKIGFSRGQIDIAPYPVRRPSETGNWSWSSTGSGLLARRQDLQTQALSHEKSGLLRANHLKSGRSRLFRCQTPTRFSGKVSLSVYGAA